MGSQQEQGSAVPDTEVQLSDTSLKKQLKDDSTPYFNKVARLEMENSSDKSWELPSGLIQYVRKYMTHYIPKRGIENFAPNNTKGTPIIDTSIKRLLIKNKNTLT